MHSSRCVPGKKVLILVGFYCSFLFSTVEVCALEPVTALDDGFAVPSKSGMVEASLHYPGAESLIKRYFAVAAWNRPFGIDDISVTTFHAGTNIGRMGVSVSYSGSGFELYGDEQEKIGVSYRLLNKVFCGIRLTRSAMRIKGFGDASAWDADMGVIIHPVDSFYLAGSFENLAGAEIGNSHEPLDGHTRFSASWRIQEDITLLVSTVKTRLFNTSFYGGFTVDMFQSMTVGAAGASEPDRLEFLGTLHIRCMECSYRGAYHRDLGMSHGFSISWRAKTAIHPKP